MKKYLLLAFLLPVLAFTACDDDDDYSLDKFWVGLATVDNPDDDAYFFLHLDDGDVIWIGATNYPNYRPKTGQRILADYTLLNDKPESSNYDHDAKLNDAYTILTKGIVHVTPETQDSIGNDPIAVRDLWVGSDYLNIRFAYLGNNRRHMLNLVSDSLKSYPDNKVHLEFRHNAFDDSPAYSAGGWVSFDLRSLKTVGAGNSIDLVIHSKDMNGENITFKRTYKINGRNDDDKEFTREHFEEGKESKVD